jgi:sugar transferase (PEP-CTERM/EpsH1 system associated)
LHVVPNGVDAAYFDPALTKPMGGADPLVSFTGRMDYFPNVDAVTWFAQSIFPRIKAAVPRARFQIVGAAPAPRVLALARESSIEVTGAVPDVRPYYAGASVCVAPLRIARGIQNKVLEAMAMSRPSVVTPAALDGIAATDGEHVLVAESEEEFARKVISVLQNAAPPALGANARARVLSHHAWSAQLAKIDALVLAAIRS